jgi:uncharacterized protein (DUF2147 family)
MGVSCRKESNSFSLSGKWREKKTESSYEKNKLENIVEFINVNEIYSGKIIGLDDPLTNQKKIRGCGYCEEKDNPMLLGYHIIRDLHYENNVFKGKMYDVYNRKWFDVKIHFINENIINVRIYAVLPIFGKNMKWTRSEDFYNEIVGRESVDLELDKKNRYAISSNNLKKINGNELYFQFDESPSKLRKIYSYHKNGNLNSELDFVKSERHFQVYTRKNGLNEIGELVYFIQK